MKIGFDAKRALFNQTGVGSYSRSIINGMAAHFPENQYYLYTPKATVTIGETSFSLQDNMQLRAPSTRFEQLIGGSAWRSLLMGNAIERDALQVYHGLSHELPYNIGKKVRKIVTIHDLLPWRYPQHYPFFDRLVYKQKWKHACQTANVVVAISQQTKQDLVDFLHIEPNKITVVPPPINPMYYDYQDGSFLQHGFFVTQQYDIPYPIPNDYILYVGSITPRKNTLMLLKALEQARHKIPDLHLVIVGNGSNDYLATLKTYIAEQKLDNNITFLHSVAEKHLPAIYRCAKLVVYPSLFEGFGLPIVEGLFSRTPVITSAGGCFKEAGGSTTQYINPNSSESIANAIELVLSSPAQRMNMIVDGWNHAQQFRVDNVTEQLMAIYKAI